MPTANNNEQELIALRETVAQLLAQNEAMSAERARIKAQVQLLTINRIAELLPWRLAADLPIPLRRAA